MDNIKLHQVKKYLEGAKDGGIRLGDTRLIDPTPPSRTNKTMLAGIEGLKAENAELKAALRELVEAAQNASELIDNPVVRDDVKYPFLNARIRASGLLHTRAEALLKEGE